MIKLAQIYTGLIISFYYSLAKLKGAGCRFEYTIACAIFQGNHLNYMMRACQNHVRCNFTARYIIRPDQIHFLMFGFAGRIIGQTGGGKWGSKVEFNAHAQLYM